MMVAGERGDGEWLFNWSRVGWDGGDGYITMWIHLSLNCALKHGLDDKFYAQCTLPHWKIN